MDILEIKVTIIYIGLSILAVCIKDKSKIGKLIDDYILYVLLILFINIPITIVIIKSLQLIGI